MELNKMNAGRKIKWYNESKYVEVDTGELITKSECERRMRVIKKTRDYEFRERNNEKYGIIKWTIECRPHEQIKLFE